MIEEWRPELNAELLRLGRTMHAESSFRDVSFSEEKISAIPYAKDVLCIFSKEGEIYTGFFAGRIGEYYFSTEKAAWDVAFFIHPDYRHGIGVVELISAYEEWAIKQGIRTDSIYLSQSTGVEIERTGRLLKGLGYEIIGMNAKKRI